jgi:cytochrome c-type biogenesis protein
MIGFLALAFVGGLISCGSTCFLPLVPAYVTYMGGRAVSVTGETAIRPQLKVLNNALLFVAGFSTVFIAFGAGAGLIGADLRAYRPLLLQVAGIALVVMGLALLGIVPWLMREARIDVAHRLPRGPWGSYLVGLAFATGWTPCVGPILAAILIKAGDTGTAGLGALLLAAYSAGLAIPFLLMAGLLGQLSRFLPRLYRASRTINAFAAVFMIGMGLLIFSNRLTVLNSYFPYFSTPLQETINASALQATPSIQLIAKGPVRVGQAAPALTVTDVDGHQLNLRDLRGRPVLINFWATWCTPCRQELPLIVSAYRAHRLEGFAVVAVDYEESPQTVKKFWTDLGLEPAPFLDPDGKVAAAYGVGLSSSGLPVSVFVGRDGRVSAFAPWALDPDFLSAQLKRIL